MQKVPKPSRTPSRNSPVNFRPSGHVMVPVEAPLVAEEDAGVGWCKPSP